MDGMKEKLARFSENFLAQEIFGIETTTAAQGNDEPFTMERLLQLDELIRPRFYFEPLEIELHDPFETIMLPYHRFSPAVNHRAILYSTVAMPNDLPKKRVWDKRMSTKEFYKSGRRAQRLLKRYWALKVGEVLLRVIEKKVCDGT